MEFEHIGAFNPGRGNNVRVQVTKSFLEGDNLITFGTFLTGHIAEDYANIGGFVKIASDIWTIALQVTTGMRSLKAMSIGFEKNIFMNKSLIVDAYGMFSNSVVDRYLSFGSYHAGLRCTDYRGHGVTVNAYHMPATQVTGIAAVAQINLWTSLETQLYLTGSVLHTFSTQFPTSNSFGYGISFGLNF